MGAENAGLCAEDSSFTGDSRRVVVGAEAYTVDMGLHLLSVDPLLASVLFARAST